MLNYIYLNHRLNMEQINLRDVVKSMLKTTLALFMRKEYTSLDSLSLNKVLKRVSKNETAIKKLG